MTTLFMTISAIVIALLVALLAVELKRDLMMFQQNSYRPERYGRWLKESQDTTSYWRLCAFVIFFIGLTAFAGRWAEYVLMAAFAIAAIASMSRKRYKKPLVWTTRARRIYAVALAAGIAASALTAVFACQTPECSLFAATECMLGCYCGSHALILIANFILKPVEKAITRRYYNDAANRLKSMPDLKIVGITGSYGKTSTKHYLHRILSEKFDTLMTPGSFNTTLGVVRTIREYLKPYNEVFIVEMGAKNIGDVREICDLVHPTAGIITAVGPQHLESFKTIDNVQRAKFELADSIPADGFVLVNDDFPKIASRKVDNCRCERYGVSAQDADWKAIDIVYSTSGTDFTVAGPNGFRLPLHTRLLGEANVSDLLAAVACASMMGVENGRIAAAVESIEPVEHRLSIKRTAGGITILDDAFNSNPVGSRMALEVLGAMKEGRRIVITPGMIELGEQQQELNRDFGQHIGRNADIAIVVGQYNREAIKEGILSTSFPTDSIVLADTFADAQRHLSSIARKGDTVLYENDLPDTFK